MPRVGTVLNRIKSSSHFEQGITGERIYYEVSRTRQKEI